MAKIEVEREDGKIAEIFYNDGGCVDISVYRVAGRIDIYTNGIIGLDYPEAREFALALLEMAGGKVSKCP